MTEQDKITIFDAVIKPFLRDDSQTLSELDLQEDSMAPELLAEAWADAVGPGLSSVSSLVSVAKGRARVTVNHPTVRYEITRMKLQIIRRLNHILGEGNVKSLLIASAKAEQRYFQFLRLLLSEN